MVDILIAVRYRSDLAPGLPGEKQGLIAVRYRSDLAPGLPGEKQGLIAVRYRSDPCGLRSQVKKIGQLPKRPP